MSAICAGIGEDIFQRSPTASEYFFPALREDAARALTVKYGWFSRRVMKRCPTIPVAPIIPAFNFSFISEAFLFDFYTDYLTFYHIRTEKSILPDTKFEIILYPAK